MIGTGTGRLNISRFPFPSVFRHVGSRLVQEAVRDQRRAQTLDIAHLDDADESRIDILEHGLAVVDDLCVGRRPVTACRLAEGVGLTQRAFKRDDGDLSTQGAVDLVARDGAAVESDDGGFEADHPVAFHELEVDFEIAIPIQHLSRVLLKDHSRVLAEVDAVAVSGDDQTTGLSVQTHLGCPRGRAHGDARVGVGQNRGEVRDHFVLDDAVIVELAGAAGKDGSFELTDRLRLRGSEEEAGGLGLDTTERVDEEGRHGGDHFRVHALAAAHETNDLASSLNAGTPVDSGEVDERCRQRLSLRNDVEGTDVRHVVALVDDNAGGDVLS